MGKLNSNEITTLKLLLEDKIHSLEIKVYSCKQDIIRYSSNEDIKKVCNNLMESYFEDIKEYESILFKLLDRED